MQADEPIRQTNTRESGIELLKLMAVFLIVIGHVVQTLCSENPLVPYDDYILDLSVATTNLQHFILTLFRYFGAWGNAVFFVCSSWFLLDSSRFKKRKWLFILVEIWVISVIILAVSYFATGGNLSLKIIISSFVPTLAGNNWYLTCYLLFYPLHPLLNIIIEKQSKRSLFRIAFVLFMLYSVMNFLKEDLFFYSRILLWIAIYFVMAYIRWYLVDFSNNLKKNYLLLLFGLGGFLGLAVMTNELGLHFSVIQDKMLYWTTQCNPFLIAIAIASFQIARNIHFRSSVINKLSSLSMLIYIIHENLILRTYMRPYIMNIIYTRFGYDRILLWVIILTGLIFVFSVICASVYDKTLRKLVRKASDFLYPFIRKGYLKLENKVLRYH